MAEAKDNQRQPLVGGNWKSYGDRAMITSLLGEWKDAERGAAKAAEVVIFPTALHLPLVGELLREDFDFGAQNCWTAEKGAFTGEISPQM